MRRLSRSSKIVFGGIASLAAVLGAAVLVQPASGARPGPMCGPTILFVCSAPGQDDVFIGLTICEVGPYEQQTGRTCEPFGG